MDPIQEQRDKVKTEHGGAAFFTWELFALFKLFTSGFGLLWAWKFWVFVLPFAFLASFLGTIPYLIKRAMISAFKRSKNVGRNIQIAKVASPAIAIIEYAVYIFAAYWSWEWLF